MKKMQPILATLNATHYDNSNCEMRNEIMATRNARKRNREMDNLARFPLFCSVVWICPVCYLVYVYFGVLPAILCEMRISPFACFRAL